MLSVSLFGCAHVGTVKSELDDPNFQSQNLPSRALSVCVVSENSWPKEDIETMIGRVSGLMAEQTGIQLQVTNWIEHPLPSFTQKEGLQSLVKIISKEHKEYDLVIGFSSRGIASQLMEVPFGAWLGAIDDNYRKFIIIKFLDERVLLHEICHAFVFAKSHSTSGVMNALLIKVPMLPFLFNIPKYLSKEDRQEILLNKWRDFNQKPSIPEEHQVDTIELSANF